MKSFRYNAILTVAGAIGFGTILYTNYTLSRNVDSITSKQSQLTESVNRINSNIEQKTVELKKQNAQLSKRVTKLERETAKLSRQQYRELNHKRVVNKLGAVPTVVTYRIKTKLNLSQREQFCLQKNIYHEAATEPLSGMIAVAQVTGNRVESKHRGTDFCSVVYARKQFSWTLDKSILNTVPDDPNWKRAGIAMKRYLSGTRIKGLEGSQFYYARYIKSPSWASDKKYTHYIGEHLFLVDHEKQT